MDFDCEKLYFSKVAEVNPMIDGWRGNNFEQASVVFFKTYFFIAVMSSPVLAAY
jgi:hypothetical protein